MTFQFPLSYRIPETPRIALLTWGGAGYMKPASGTWGTLAGIPFALLIHIYTGPVGLVLTAIALYALSFYAVRAHEKETGEHDQSMIVVDEVIGLLITLIPASVGMIDYVAAFFLFRMFDAIKPGIIGRVDKNVHGAHGVLLDDVLAGAAAALCIAVMHAII